MALGVRCSRTRSATRRCWSTRRSSVREWTWSSWTCRRVLRFLPGTPEGRVRIARGELSGGTYFYRLTGALRMTGRVVIE